MNKKHFMRAVKILLVVALVFSNFAFSAISVSAADDYNKLLGISAPASIAPGNTYNLCISYMTSVTREIMVDFMDSSTYYTGKKVKVYASPNQQGTIVSLTIPTTINSPSTCFFTVKLIPENGQWNQYIDQINVNVAIDAAKPITVPLNYSGTLSAYNNKFTTTDVTLKGASSSVTINKNAGSLNTQYGILTEATSYGAITSSLLLNLETGEISDKLNLKTYAAPNKGGNAADYLVKLRDLKYSVDAVKNGITNTIAYNIYVSPRPEMVQASNYLNTLINNIYSSTGDKISCAVPTEVAANDMVTLPVNYIAKQTRDILVSFHDKNYNSLAETRVTVQQGYGTSYVNFTVPSSLNGSTTGYFIFKILPQGGNWTQKIDEVIKPVSIMTTDKITNATYTNTYSRTEIDIMAYYFAPQDREIMIDIFDGSTLVGSYRGPAYAGNYTSYGRFYVVNLPSNIATGKTLKCYVKLIPVGGTWNQYLSQYSFDVKV